jgi:hypothetical protein
MRWQGKSGTDNIRVEMSTPITREEFAELAVRLLEVYTGKTPVAAQMLPLVTRKMNMC